MPGELVRAKECRLVICRDSRRRRHQTRDEVVLPTTIAGASRRVRLSDVPTSKEACSCLALFPAESPRTRGLQKACPRDQFGRSMFSARELRKSLRFPWVRLLSTTPFDLYFGKVFPSNLRRENETRPPNDPNPNSSRPRSRVRRSAHDRSGVHTRRWTPSTSERPSISKCTVSH